MANVARVLTIAGSDSGGGAGIQADLKTFTVLGTYGMSVITAVTAQNTLGVAGVYPLSAGQVAAQLEAVLSDIGTDAAKTGMLADASVIEVVAAAVRKYKVENLVVDPVMVAKSGHKLLADEAHEALKRRLVPLAAVVTPNIREAEELTGMAVRTKDDMVEAGRRLVALGCRAALVKGGHLEGDSADDVLVTASGVRWFRGPKIATQNTHGTGCTLSAAIAAGLASGLTPVAAVEQAKRFITDAIAQAPKLGGGHGPTNHLVWLGRSVLETRETEVGTARAGEVMAGTGWAEAAKGAAGAQEGTAGAAAGTAGRESAG